MGTMAHMEEDVLLRTDYKFSYVLVCLSCLCSQSKSFALVYKNRELRDMDVQCMSPHNFF